MRHRIVPTAEYDEAVKLGLFKRSPTCFGVHGPPGQLHGLAKQNGLTRRFYKIVPVAEPVVSRAPQTGLS